MERKASPGYFPRETGKADATPAFGNWKYTGLIHSPSLSAATASTVPLRTWTVTELGSEDSG